MKDMLFHHGIVLGDGDEGLVDRHPGISEQRLRNRKRQAAGPGRIEQEAFGDALIDAGSLRTVIHIDIAAGDEIGVGINGHGMGALIEERDLIQRSAGSSEDQSIKRVDCPIVLAVETEIGVELRLLNDDVGQPTFFHMTTDRDVEVVLQRPNGGIGQRHNFTPLHGSRLGCVQAPTVARKQEATDNEQNGSTNHAIRRVSEIHTSLLPADGRDSMHHEIAARRSDD